MLSLYFLSFRLFYLHYYAIHFQSNPPSPFPQALLKSKNSAEPYLQSILAQTRGICFLGTPHCGASLTAWASLCGNFTNLVRRTNKNILNVLNPDSEVLANIQEEFHTMLRARANQGEKAIWVMCFFEELPIVGMGLVSFSFLVNYGIGIGGLQREDRASALSCFTGVWLKVYPCESYRYDEV